MDLKKFVSVLSPQDQETLRQLLDVNNKEKKEAEAKKIAQWEKGEKPKLLAKIDAASKEVASLKNQQIELDLKLIFSLKSTVDAQDIKESLKSGYCPDFNYEITGKATALDGKRNKVVTLINAHLDSFLDNACDDVLELFPEYKKNVDKLETKCNEIRNEVRVFSNQNLNLQ
jgi:hypothetical protein